MTSRITSVAATVATLAGVSAVSSAGAQGVAARTAKAAVVAAQPGDTATVKLHISGMTCGSCPVTARLALNKQPGVLDAKVTLDDSLGVVRYNRRKVTAQEIAARLTKLTGYGARVIDEPAKSRR